jgi:CheY-like chemotaxis protein
MGSTNGAPATILLVEDNPDDALFAKRAFSKICPHATLAVTRDGEEAINYLAGNGEYQDRSRHPWPSLVLLDLKLPRKNGLEVLEWMRGMPSLRTMPVIVLSSSNEPQDVQRASDLGVLSYHVKPVTIEAFMDVAQSICQEWQELVRNSSA